ncbi:MAG: CPBP family intramembrane glutamic endopeptidase [Terriglobales bacterium]
MTRRQRLISLGEFLLGAAIVIGHNVYHKVPNEVPILFVLGWISIQVRNGGWKSVGLKRPTSWWKTVAWALAAAALITVLSDVVVGPLAEKHFGVRQDSKALGTTTHSAVWVLEMLAVVWGFAAFGEEMGYRGYLLNRAAEIGNRSKAADLVALLLVSVLFGYGHYYKGYAGVIASSVSGLVLGAAYLLSRRNLWVNILAHGFRDTFAIVAALLGWSN